MRATYHEGELAVQERAGVREMADRVGRSIHATIPPLAREFLVRQPMVIIGAADRKRRVWASLLTGAPGFMRATGERMLHVGAHPAVGDRLAGELGVGDQVGMLAIEPLTRRRLRLNGVVEKLTADGFTVRAAQVYSNCPKYIQARARRVEEPGAQGESETSVIKSELPPATGALTASRRELIATADTFFIASLDASAGADASHRGGAPGFVRVRGGRTLAWGDYAGNSMFQTLGNIESDGRAGLVFVDWERGDALQLTGRAAIVWDASRAAEFAGAERVIEFQIEDVAEVLGATKLRWRFVERSPFNPA